MDVKIVNNSKNRLPKYSTIASAGMDLRANIDHPIVLKTLERTIIKTGEKIIMGTKLQGEALVDEYTRHNPS